jgi:CBS domain-containing protein
MTTDPACCTPDTSLREVARFMVENDCGCIPVVDGIETRRPIGTITDRDITSRTVARGKNPLKMKARDAMTHSCITTTADTDAKTCCEIMESNKIRRVVVVDEDGRCCGIVSQGDLACKADEKVTIAVVQAVSQPGRAMRWMAVH